VEASTEGVLGGYGCVNDVDVKGSDAFLRPLLAERFGAARRHLVALGEFTSVEGYSFWLFTVLELYTIVAVLICSLIHLVDV
jgi:hypothetical protein